MNRDDARDIIKTRYAEYLQPARTRANGKPTYICPLCGNGSGENGDGLAIDPHGDGTQLKCFKCGFYGDIVDLYQQQNHCDVGTAFNALYERFGIVIDESMPARSNMPQERIQDARRGEKKNFISYYTQCVNNLKQSPQARNYLNSRGLTAGTIEKYCLGYDPEKKRVIIPADVGFYLARDITGENPLRYENPKDAQAELFNRKELYTGGTVIYVTEGVFDALAMIETGVQAVALNSASNVNLLLQTLQERPTKKTILLCLDNDDAGIRQTKQLMQGLEKLHTDYKVSSLQLLSGGYKDPCEALTADREVFTSRVRAYTSQIEREATKPDNAADYIKDRLQDDIKQFQNGAERKTGFPVFDRMSGGIFSGLYVLGAISSLGKTTFIHQIADQLAERGSHVLYFSLEQSRLEMICKSISRMTARINIDEAVTSLQIRKGKNSETVQQATQKYITSAGERMNIIEGNFNCTVSYIHDYAARYSERNNVKPIIIIDYLQIMQPEVDPETGRKPTDPRLIADYNVTALKRMTRELDVPVLVISSVNRSNYLTEIDFESFKESGGIEFTADVVLGLQLQAIHDPVFQKANAINEKRETIRDAKGTVPREVELVCLKNRFGEPFYSINYEYMPQFDYFREELEEDPKAQQNITRRI